MSICTFCDVRDKKLPAKILYEDADVFVIPDMHPQKPVHILVIPKKHIKEFGEVEEPLLFQKFFVVMQKMVKQSGLQGKKYQIKINGGGAQIIDHLHLHLMGPLSSSV